MKRIPVIALCLTMLMASIATISSARSYGDHPFYLQALSDLRAARWLIDHRAGDWKKTVDEKEAVSEIDAAIRDIKKAAIDDHKDINDHPQMNEISDNSGRLNEAIDYLKKAREDISHDEDNRFGGGLRDKAYKHLDLAIKATKKAIHQ